MKTKQEKITLEKLAIMIKIGFDSVDKKFEKVKVENERQHEEIKKELKDEIQILWQENAKEHEKMRRDNSREHDDLKLRQDSSVLLNQYNVLHREKYLKVCCKNVFEKSVECFI